MKPWTIAACILLLGVYSIATAHACSCRGPATCGAFHPNDAAFVGTILSRKPITPEISTGTSKFQWTGYTFRVRVTESFSGLKEGQEVSVRTGAGGGDCGYEFEIGRQYLIDASINHDKGVFGTSICTLTSLATPDNVALYELRLRAHGKPIPDVSGSIAQDGPPLKWGEEKPLLGIRVKLQRVGALSSLQAVTDNNGMYAFHHVPEGSYQVNVDGLPPNLAVSGSNLKPFFTSEIGELRVPDHPTTSAACHLWISAGPSGRINGRILASPKLLSDIEVSAYAIGKDGKRGELISARSPNEDGEFRLTYLPAGRYRVIFEHGPKLKGPSIDVTVADGEQKELGDVRLK